MMEEITDPSITNLKGEDTAQLTPEGCSFISGSKSKIRKVAIIGAGAAGLCAARHFFTPGSGFTGCVYEGANDIGGTWLYTDDTGKNKYGLPIHTALYSDLWTNLPKEAMTFPDFHYNDEETRSYLPAHVVLQYLVDYADHNNLHPYIKLNHNVTRVAPVGNSWSVSVLDLITQVEHVSMFDAVMVCSGSNILPFYPEEHRLARFSGEQLHSKKYRRARDFKGKRVLIIGLGPSGVDISFQLIPVAKQVIISHNKPSLQGLDLPKNVKIKPIVTSMQDKTITFSDGTEEEVDVMIHCTGYMYHYPFLTSECDLIVDKNITPLYRHFINIEHPTMALIGIPRKCPFMFQIDYEVRAFMNLLKGKVSLPSKEIMLKEMEEDRALRAAEGQRKKDYHMMNTVRNEEYFKQLAELGGLEPIPPVIIKLFTDAFKSAVKDLVNFRNTTYTILDNDNYSKSSTKTSIVGVKFADDDHSKVNEEPAGENEIQVKKVETSEEYTKDLTASKESQPLSKEMEEEVKIIHEKTQVEEVVEMKHMFSTSKEATVIRSIEETTTEKIIQKGNGGMFRVEAVVEITHPKEVNKNEDNEAAEKSTLSDGDDFNKNVKNTTVNCESVKLGLQDTSAKPTCGDEIVKIIQTGEGAGFR